MPFADWTQFIDGDASASLDLATPVVAAGSVILSSTASTIADRAVEMHLKPGFQRGYQKGRIRSLIRIDRTLSASYVDDGPGFYFMCNNLDITGTPSDFYWAGLRINNQMDIVLRKASTDQLSGMTWQPGDPDNIADSVIDVVVSLGDIIPFQVEWDADPDNLGGTRIIVSRGGIGELDFNNLSVDYDLVDSVSPYTSSVVEGIGWAHRGTGILLPIGLGWTFDNTGIFRLI